VCVWGGCRCKVNALGPGVSRDSALAHDTEEAGVEKAWTASQRPFAHLEMCPMLPTARGTQCWSLSLWLQCPPEPRLHLHKGQDTCGPERPAPAAFTRGDGYRGVLWVAWGVGSGRCQKVQTQRAWSERKFEKKSTF